MTEAKSARHKWISRLMVAFKVIGIILFIYLIFSLDLEELGKLLQRIQLHYFAYAVLFNITLLNTFKIFRWYLIVRWMDVDYSFKDSYLAYQSAIFLGMMTPGRMGELLRSVYLKIECDTPIYRGISSVLIDRVFDLMGLLTLAGLSLLLTKDFGNFQQAGWYFIVAAIVVLILLFVLRYAPAKRFRSMGISGQNFFTKTVASLNHQLQSLSIVKIISLAGATVLSLSVYSAEVWFISKALGLDLAIITVTGVAASATMVEVLPVTIYGLGTREATVISLLGFLAISETTAFSFALLLFTNFWIGGGLWAIPFWLAKPMKAKSVMKKFDKQTAEEDED